MSLVKRNISLNEGAAPLCAWLSLAASSGKRLRRRGPRSQLIFLRRSVPRCRRTLPDMSPGESGDAMSDTLADNETQSRRNDNLNVCTPDLEGLNSCLEGVYIYNVNIQSLNARLVELI